MHIDWIIEPVGLFLYKMKICKKEEKNCKEMQVSDVSGKKV